MTEPREYSWYVLEDPHVEPVVVAGPADKTGAEEAAEDAGGSQTLIVHGEALVWIARGKMALSWRDGVQKPPELGADGDGTEVVVP